MLKTCTSCRATKSTNDYYFDRKKQRHIAKCKECWKQLMKPRSKKHYENNKSDYRKRARKRAKNLAKIVNEYKLSNPGCKDCKLEHPPYRLDFDHLPGQYKVAMVSKVSRLGWSVDKLLEEIAKCELVCANCHRDRTFARRARRGSNP